MTPKCNILNSGTFPNFQPESLVYILMWIIKATNSALKH